MGKDSKIEWTHHTFNPWWGCVKVSPGCTHCYAESFAKRIGTRILAYVPRDPAVREAEFARHKTAVERSPNCRSADSDVSTYSRAIPGSPISL